MSRDIWECLFVGRIGKDNRIVLRKPSEWGRMFESYESKLRFSIPTRACGNLLHNSNEDKVFKATAIAITYNLEELIDPRTEGLIVKGVIKGSPVLLLGKTGSTGWLIYVTHKDADHEKHKLKLYYIDDNRAIGSRLSEEEEEKIFSCANSWKD